MQADIALIGLAVMGQNLILNMNDKGFKVVAYNRTQAKVDAFLQEAAAGTNVVGASSLEDMLSQLKTPRKVMLMVRAGEAVDKVIEQLLPLMDKGDIIIDGGNSNFEDTVRRVAALKPKGIGFLGAGISGGEEGARHGPSIMPGGDEDAWPPVKPIFQAIAAKTDSDEVCCDWVGAGGAGHFVKMVHNGIEYGDMQLIAEVYHFMQAALGLSYEQMQTAFESWNVGALESYLIEITADIMGVKDDDGGAILDKILDAAAQKGTGKWTSIKALELGVPLSLITESVLARFVSALKESRVEANAYFGHQVEVLDGNTEAWVESLKHALLASKIISYAQGFMLMREASEARDWKLEYGNVALMWREGCIIRSAFLENIRDAYANDPDIEFLGQDAFFQKALKSALPHWRKVCAKGIELGVPMPCMTSALSFLDSFTCERLPANLIQAQRDYFGAHTYERTDKPRGEYFHTDWNNTGGVSSTTYEA